MQTCGGGRSEACESSISPDGPGVLMLILITHEMSCDISQPARGTFHRMPGSEKRDGTAAKKPPAVLDLFQLSPSSCLSVL